MAKKKKAIKKQTLNEFKAWLEGVEELQTDSWAPDKSQWDKIRTRIENIKPDELTVQPAGRPLENPMFATPAPSAPMTIPGYIPPPITSGIPMPPADIVMSSAAKEMLSGPSGRTPDVDASQGEVPSSFE